MNLETIKKEIGRKRNGLSDASVISTRCNDVVTFLLRKEDLSLEMRLLIERNHHQIQQLYQKYANSVVYDGFEMKGDSLRFAEFSNYCYNFVDSLQNEVF